MQPPPCASRTKATNRFLDRNYCTECGRFSQVTAMPMSQPDQPAARLPSTEDRAETLEAAGEIAAARPLSAGDPSDCCVRLMPAQAHYTKKGLHNGVHRSCRATQSPRTTRRRAKRQEEAACTPHASVAASREMIFESVCDQAVTTHKGIARAQGRLSSSPTRDPSHSGAGKQLRHTCNSFDRCIFILPISSGRLPFCNKSI